MEITFYETNPVKNHQENGASLPLGIQPSLPQLTLIDTLVSPDEPLPRNHVKARDAARLAHEADLLEVCIQRANYMLFRVYHYWVHKNTVKPSGWRNHRG